MRSVPRLAALSALAAMLAACAGAPQEARATHESTVLELFDLARADELAPERVDALFGTEADERVRAVLLDAIDALRPAAKVRIVETYPMDDLIRTSFELESALPGGGLARYSVQLDTSTEPGTIVWFSGPGVEWPARKTPGPGLSTSAPPESPSGG